MGTSLGTTGVAMVLQTALNNATLNVPISDDAIYILLTSPDVKEGSLCSRYCGYHSYFSWSSVTYNVKYAFIGSCLGTVCEPAPLIRGGASSLPNSDVITDSIASVIVHEIEETATDPEINGWIDNSENENGDLCAWRFSPIQTSASGKTYNVLLGGRNWLIQQNWDPANGGGCVMSIDHGPWPPPTAPGVLGVVEYYPGPPSPPNPPPLPPSPPKPPPSPPFNGVSSKCEAYTVSGTSSSATSATDPTCGIQLCAGQTLSAGTCTAPMSTCVGDTFLRLFAPDGVTEVGVNDDFCRMCSYLVYTASSTGLYRLRQGCYSASTCGGTVGYTISGSCGVSSPSPPLPPPLPSPVPPPPVAPVFWMGPAAAGQSCTSACASQGGCVETAWPASMAAFTALLASIPYTCPAAVLDGYASTNPEMDGTNGNACFWQPSGGLSGRCGLSDPSASRFCP